MHPLGASRLERDIQEFQEVQVLAMLQDAITALGGLSAFARLHGFSVPFVSDVMLRRRPLSDRILETVGVTRTVERVVIYKFFRKRSKQQFAQWPSQEPKA